MNREEWLLSITNKIRPRFADLGYPLPTDIYVSVGWPSTRPLASKKKRIGECWNAGEPNPHVYISPLLTQEDALHVLLHELVHAALPPEDWAQEGLRRPGRATRPGEAVDCDYALRRMS